MDVGIGLPAGIPNTTGEMVVDWAARADAGPFASVGVVDRLVYDSFDPLIALAAAAAVTSRVQLATSILIAPLRETATLGKQLRSLQSLSGSRLTVGMALGARGDDYEISDLDQSSRGDRFSHQLDRFDELWEGSVIGPLRQSHDRPGMLVGGSSGPALARMAQYADGYIHGGGPPRAFARAADEARAAWADAGRPSEPSLWGMGYYAIGDAADSGREYLLDYYAFTGEFATRIADGLLTTDLEVRDFVAGYADAGCDHLILFPAANASDQLDRLAECLIL